MKKFTFLLLLCSILGSTGQSQQPKWSFGFEYAPKILNTGIVYYEYTFPPFIFFGSFVETTTDAHLSYFMNPKVAITTSFGMTEITSVYRNERYLDYDTSDNYPPDSTGYILDESIKTLQFSVGLKYYFKQFEIKKVRPFSILEFGKQMARVTDEYTDLIDDPDDNPPTENEDEYYSDLNSPVFLTGGFGAEYSFNESLSLFAAYRIQYEKVTAKYSYYSQSDDSSYEFEEYKENEEVKIKNRASIGLNFYF